MSAQDSREELDRLAAVLGKALDRAAKVQLLPYAADCIYAHASTGDHIVETGAHLNSAKAVAELRTILRADTDGAVADVLDELVQLSEEGLFSVEMLRTMAAARRSR